MRRRGMRKASLLLRLGLGRVELIASDCRVFSPVLSYCRCNAAGGGESSSSRCGQCANRRGGREARRHWHNRTAAKSRPDSAIGVDEPTNKKPEQNTTHNQNTITNIQQLVSGGVRSCAAHQNGNQNKIDDAKRERTRALPGLACARVLVALLARCWSFKA